MLKKEYVILNARKNELLMLPCQKCVALYSSSLNLEGGPRACTVSLPVPLPRPILQERERESVCVQKTEKKTKHHTDVTA